MLFRETKFIGRGQLKTTKYPNARYTETQYNEGLLYIKSIFLCYRRYKLYFLYNYYGINWITKIHDNKIVEMSSLNSQKSETFNQT